MGVLADLTNLMMALFIAPICLLIRGEVLPRHKIHPTSGVRQGCPLCTSIFAMLISLGAHKLTAISPQLQVLRYALDLLIIVTGNRDRAVFIFILAWADIKSGFSSLHQSSFECARHP